VSITSALFTIAAALAAAAVVAALLFRQHRQLARWRDEASRDPLTGLANRRALTAHLQEALAAGHATSVALLDLDHFKQVNDAHGHGAGDDLLITIAGRLNTVGGPITLIARLGGDEFVLVLASTDPCVLDTIAAAIHAVITGRTISLGRGRWVDIGVSIGLAAATGGTGARLLLHQADAAMYTAKHAGGGIHRHQPAGPLATPISERPVVRQRDQRATAQPAASGDAGARPAHGPGHQQRDRTGGGR
jgi:diguanylate cyclase (GGDEF)-like protein